MEQQSQVSLALGLDARRPQTSHSSSGFNGATSSVILFRLVATHKQTHWLKMSVVVEIELEIPAFGQRWMGAKIDIQELGVIVSVIRIR